MTPDAGGLVIVGAGGAGRGALDVVDQLRAAGVRWTFLGFLDDVPGPEVLGPVDDLRHLTADAYVIAIADPAVRSRLDLDSPSPGILVAPTAALGRGTRPGPGSVIRSNASLASRVRFGRHVYLNMNATVGHDAVLGDHVTVHPGANLGGAVVLEPGATIGAGAVVLPTVRIGRGATVGAGAVVVDDVAPGVTVVGVPATPRGPRAEDGPTPPATRLR